MTVQDIQVPISRIPILGDLRAFELEGWKGTLYKVGESRFTVVNMWNTESTLMLLSVNYCAIFHPSPANAPWPHLADQSPGQPKTGPLIHSFPGFRNPLMRFCVRVFQAKGTSKTKHKWKFTDFFHLDWMSWEGEKQDISLDFSRFSSSASAGFVAPQPRSDPNQPPLPRLVSVLAIELLAACQGIEFLRPLKTTTPLEKVYDLVRSVVRWSHTGPGAWRQFRAGDPGPVPARLTIWLAFSAGPG